MGRDLAIGAVTLGGVPRVVAAGGEAEVDALANATDADLVELRADLFDDPRAANVTAALGRLRAAGRPVILTVRAASEGGRALDEGRRRDLYAAGLPLADAIDVEIASTALAAELVPAARAAGRTVILSAHALDGTPPRAALLDLVTRGGEAGADVVKLAAVARDAADLQTLIAVTLAAGPQPVVTLAMGPLGPLSRIVLPAAGSLLTYGHVGRATAAGQLPVAELASLVRRLFPS